MPADFRLWHKADMLNALTNVRFWGQSRQGADLSVCPLMTPSGHCPRPLNLNHEPKYLVPVLCAVAFFRLCGSFATNYGRPYGCII